METNDKGTAQRIAIFAYGVAVYALFLVTFLYAFGFVGNLLVPKSIDTVASEVPPLWQALLVNAGLLSLFVIQHTIMARPAFKAWWTRIIPRAMERSTFVLATCIVLGLTFWLWQPMPAVVWNVAGTPAVWLLHTSFAAGMLLVLYSSFCIDHFDLFGLRQVVLHLRNRSYTHPGFAVPALYRMVRNPLMLGFLIAFWSAPVMTQGRLLFAILTTLYIVCVGIPVEERDLLHALGEKYRTYRERTPMLLPWPRPRRKPAPAGPVEAA